MNRLAAAAKLDTRADVDASVAAVDSLSKLDNEPRFDRDQAATDAVCAWRFTPIAKRTWAPGVIALPLQQPRKKAADRRARTTLPEIFELAPVLRIQSLCDGERITARPRREHLVTM